MTTQTEITQRNHHRAVRFFWGLLIGATMVSLSATLRTLCCHTFPDRHPDRRRRCASIALLAAVHGIALAVRAGASGRVYRWAVSATAAIGVGAFAVSFLALRDLMQDIGYSPATAWIFPAIIDTAVAVSTLMLVALGDKPARRARTVTTPASAQNPAVQRAAAQSAKAEVTPLPPRRRHRRCKPTRAQDSASVQLDPAQTCVSASRGDTGRCRPCIRPDCIRRDDAVRRHGDRSALGPP